ncbi:MAG: PepSY domain-containing protein [Alphaproteobacteria bacterium]|jgi:hypothetical protein|nr:PepSY domain-containing protein [Alphaproteobacteria bacterium]MBN9557040.1 PepSY domain-containing protein [Alphaproteobacteria bacterium]MBN9567724.1 PepSY domain-containing protein [Alphaproteobacteria bacterium]MBN9578945.1 PepSY domain-containing protein [Alphaproteobacteria bacterium]MBN9591563.1 PepSY domain-containing protein [Alphaproteobacteria bacterium]
MKKIAVPLFAAVFCIAAIPSYADTPGPDWMPPDQVIQKLRQAGYTSIREIEADNGRWEGEGIKNGVRMDFHADAKTGTIISEKPDK